MPCDLPLTRVAADLLHHIANLRDARSAYRMSLGFQPAAGIDWTLAMQTSFSSQRVWPSFAFLHEAQVFDCQDLGDGETVVYFGELDVVRPNARHLVRLLCRRLQRAQGRDVVLLIQ